MQNTSIVKNFISALWRKYCKENNVVFILLSFSLGSMSRYLKVGVGISRNSSITQLSITQSWFHTWYIDTRIPRFQRNYVFKWYNASFWQNIKTFTRTRKDRKYNKENCLKNSFKDKIKPFCSPGFLMNSKAEFRQGEVARVVLGE